MYKFRSCDLIKHVLVKQNCCNDTFWWICHYGFLYCKLFTITTGASCVGRFLKNCNLQVLDMRGNHISDDGMSLLVEGLLCNKTLTRLDVVNCGLSVKGTICNSCYTGGSGLPDMYTLTVGPHVYMSDKAQPHVLQITCFTSLKYWKLQHSTEVVHVVQLVTHWCLVPVYRSEPWS